MDGVLTASSGDMQYPDMKELSFELPPDAGELKLVAKAPGSHFATGCCFGNPVFTKKATPGEMTLSTIPDGKNPNPAGVYTFRGTAYADSVEVFVDGVKMGAATPDAGWNWEIPVDFKEKINHVIQIKSVVDGAVIQTETFNYLMNDDVTYASALKVKSWTGLESPTVYAVNPSMSVGGSGRYRSNFGFQNHPLNGTENNFGAADINIDISGLGYTYFQTVVGKDDAVNQGGTGIEFLVLVDGEIKARSGNMGIYEAANLACEIPEDAKELTLRITNYDGNYTFGTGDWCNPILSRGKDALYTKTVPAGDASAERDTVDLADGAAMHFVTAGGIKGITVPHSDSMEGTLTAELYKYVGSYFSSLKRSPAEKAKLGDGAGNQTLIFSDVLEPGAYILVLKGKGTLAACSSDTCVLYQGQEMTGKALDVSVHFEETASEPFFGKAEGNVGNGDAPATIPDAEEKKAAKAVYDAYLAEGLKNFPVSMTIGEKEYTGFGDSRFSVKGQKTVPNSRNGEETETVIVYTPEDPTLAGVTFTVTSVYYENYAAYDWVIYFSNEDGTKRTPVISDIHSAIAFPGEDPYVYGYSGDPTGFTPAQFCGKHLRAYHRSPGRPQHQRRIPLLEPGIRRRRCAHRRRLGGTVAGVLPEDRLPR